MKWKLLATLLAAAMLVSPVLGFWHPPEERYPQHPAFAVLINGKYAWTFTEPADNFCDTFTVEVGILNVTDLFGYEFKLWWNTTYFNLVSYTVEQTWPSQFQVLPAADYDLSAPYQQVVTAMDPSLGVSGDIKVATLTFHINNDVCWCQGTISGWFYVTDGKASNSCSQSIMTCDPTNAYWQFVPKQPKIYIDPATINCSKVGTTFGVTVWLNDTVKMTDFSVCIQWNGKHVVNPCQNFWTALLYTKKENVVINEDVFPTANRTTSTITVTSPKCGVYQADPVGSVCVNVVMDPSFPLINGTVWLYKVTFTQCDPWYCGAQPLYHDNSDHTWTLEEATTNICFQEGWISVKCPDPDYILFGEDSGICKTYGPQCAVPCQHPAYAPNKWVDDSYVNPDNVTHFKTMQHAIDVALANDVIEVLPGTYYGNVIVWSDPSIGRSKNLTIYARDGPTVTIVDASTVEPGPQDWPNSMWRLNSWHTLPPAKPNPPWTWKDPFSWAKVHDPGLLRNGFIVLNNETIIDGFQAINARYPDWNRGNGILVGTISTTYTAMYPPFRDGWGGTYPIAGKGGINASNCIIRNNIISYPSDGIRVDDGSSNNIIECNIVIGADRRPDGLEGGDAIIIWQADPWQGGGYNLVENNIVYDSYTGVKMGTYGQGMIKFNGTRITHNRLTGNYYGVNLLGVLPGDGVTWDSGDPIMIDDNDLSNDHIGAGKNTLPYVDATKNWWGDRRGPGIGGASPIEGYVLYDPWIACCKAVYEGAAFTFIPIPGDLDGSGHTGIEDLMIEAAYYGNPGDCSKPAGSSANALNYYYDLNKDGVMDVYDLVIVAKNFCNDKP